MLTIFLLFYFCTYVSYILEKYSDFVEIKNFSDSDIIKYMTEQILGPDTTKDLIHYIYPDGISVPDNMMDPNVGGKFKKCRHIYEYVNAEICPDCGRDTHEPDWELSQKIIRDHYESGEHLKYIDPVSGGTILGWWSI